MIFAFGGILYRGEFMKGYLLPCTKEQLLSALRSCTETATQEHLQASKKEAVFYSGITDPLFDLYERPALSGGKGFSLGGIRIRGAVTPHEEKGCQVAIEYQKSPDSIKAMILCLFFLSVSLVITLLSESIFSTMFPLLGLICLCYLLGDLFASLLQKRRLR